MLHDRSPLFRNSFFGILYFVQGMILTYTFDFAKPYLANYNVDPDRIGLLVGLLVIPFVVKIFYGMLSDRVNLFGLGHRLPYIGIALVVCGMSIAAAGRVDPSTHFTYFATFLLIAAFAIALFDTTADGLAVDITPVDEQDGVQSIMTVGRAIGMIAMSLLVAYIADHFGYWYVYLIMALSMALPFFWLLQTKEPPRNDHKENFNWQAFKEMGTSSYLIFSVYGVVSWISYQGLVGLVTLFMQEELQATIDQIGQYATVKNIGTMVGGLMTGWLLYYLGRKRVSVLSAVLICFFGVVFAFTTHITFVTIAGFFWGIVQGLHWTVYTVLAMSRTDSRIAGSMFAISMAVSNIGTAIGDGVATSLTDNYSFATVFLMLAVFNLLVFPLLSLVFKFAPPEEQKLIELKEELIPEIV